MAVKTIMSLMNVEDNYDLSNNSALLTNELNWIAAETGAPPAEALLIPYAYNGIDYPSFFKHCSAVFGQSGLGINLTDTSSGNPASLISSARMIVIPGGEIKTFIKLLNQLITPTFNPWTVIRNLVLNGVPLVAWNEGAALASPKPFVMPSADLTTTIGASPYQFVNNYTVTVANKTAIKSFLQNNTSVQQVTCMVSALVADKGRSRIEDNGNGILQFNSPAYPAVINYKLVRGVLVES